MVTSCSSVQALERTGQASELIWEMANIQGQPGYLSTEERVGTLGYPATDAHMLGMGENRAGKSQKREASSW